MHGRKAVSELDIRCSMIVCPSAYDPLSLIFGASAGHRRGEHGFKTSQLHSSLPWPVLAVLNESLLKRCKRSSSVAFFI